MKGDHLTVRHQRKAAAQRTHQPDFIQHNQQISHDAAARQRVKLRAHKGSNLLLSADVHQCWLGDIRDTLGASLSEGQRRIILGGYIWRYLQEGLCIELPRPRSPCAFFALVAQAKQYAGQGLSLPHPLFVMALAPEDFGRKGPRPLPRDRQKKRYRAALYEARRAAEDLQNHEEERQQINDHFLIMDLTAHIDAYFAHLMSQTPPTEMLEMLPSPPRRKRGVRHPMETRPHLQRSDTPFRKPYLLCYGPQRPYVLPRTADHHPAVWLRYGPGDEEETLQEE